MWINFDSLRQIAEREAELELIGEELRKRLARVLDVKKTALSDKAGNSDTERFNRLLVMWLDLHRAMSRVRQSKRPDSDPRPVPWHCDDADVSRIWERLTRPENSAALTEWLFQSASGEQEVWAQNALIECHKRTTH